VTGPDPAPGLGPDPAIVAMAVGDPLSPATASGLPAHLFGAIRDQGVALHPVTSRRLRWYDALTGAVDPAGLVRSRVARRYAACIRPDWYWSRRGFERFSGRVAAELAALPPVPLLQIGTHVRPPDRDAPAYCFTDLTVAQALEAGEFAVSGCSPDVAAEAVECQREVFEHSEKVFVISRWTGDSVIRDYGIPEDKVVVAGSAANIAGQPGWEPDRDPDPGAPYILFVGLHWERKGGPLLVEAFRRVRAERPGVRLVVVGCRPAVGEPGVEVLGQLPRADAGARRRLAALFAGAACVAIPSRFDPHPHVLLEAQLAGVPVITLAGQGRPEALLDGLTGVLVREPEPDALAGALLTVLRPEVGRRMGAAARQFAAGRFTWPRVARRVLDQMGVLPDPHVIELDRPSARVRG
jgi:glycosyltransferase involved in cell wall biosynthesis